MRSDRNLPRAGITVSLVVAVSQNGVIGRDGDLPWKLSTDLKRFKALTTGKPVIMGRRTWQSIGRPLPGRANIVVTRDPSFRIDGVHVVHDLGDALSLGAALARDAGGAEVCVIGGGTLYAQAMDAADVLYVTHVEQVVDGDTRFPDIDPAIWEKTAEETVPAGDKDNYPTRFVSYRRRAL